MVNCIAFDWIVVEKSCSFYLTDFLWINVWILVYSHWGLVRLRALCFGNIFLYSYTILYLTKFTNVTSFVNQDILKMNSRIFLWFWYQEKDQKRQCSKSTSLWNSFYVWLKSYYLTKSIQLFIIHAYNFIVIKICINHSTLRYIGYKIDTKKKIIYQKF